MSHVPRQVAIAVVALTAALCAACGGSPAGPSKTAPPPPVTPTDAPVARVSVTADSSGARDAVAGLSEVVVDAAGSTGSGALTFTIDFGDGTRATSASARHVYGSPGTFAVSVEVRDTQGRAGSVSQQVSVKALTGSWFHAGYNANVHRVEVRRLDVTSHEGSTVRGIYKVSNAPDRAFTGTLKAPRSITIVADTTTLEGSVPARLGDDGDPWMLEARGGTLSGSLSFRAIVGAPTGPEPDADLRLRIDSLGSNSALVDLSPMVFDGSQSRGTALSYFLEFGDDQIASEARAVHPPTRLGILTARMTVVDRFGRADVESSSYFVFGLNAASLDSWFSSNGGSEFLSFRFESRRGTTYEGIAGVGSSSSGAQHAPCVAVLSGERDVLVRVPSLDLEFRGVIDMSGVVFMPSGGLFIQPRLVLTQSGGPSNGRTWTLRYDDGPG